ncbi:MAG: MerR family transcriptional regulator [Coriobacteriales bacterium]|nr:MerR family transcriptional regulator [Coriobacteriales bacterium]
MGKRYRIEEAAQFLGISKDTLRYYDRIGLVCPTRGENRYRSYTDRDLELLMNAQVMKYAGFTLKEIGLALDLIGRLGRETPELHCEVAELIRAKKAEVDERRERLQKISWLLAEAASTTENFGERSDERLSRIVRQAYAGIRANQKES